VLFVEKVCARNAQLNSAIQFVMIVMAKERQQKNGGKWQLIEEKILIEILILVVYMINTSDDDFINVKCSIETGYVVGSGGTIVKESDRGYSIDWMFN